MKYIVYRGLRRKDVEEYEYEEGKMELTLTILSKDSSYRGMYYAPILQRKKLTLKQIEKIWKGNSAYFESTQGNKLHRFHTDIFCSPSWKEREECIRRFEEHNTVEKILPGHYEF